MGESNSNVTSNHKLRGPRFVHHPGFPESGLGVWEREGDVVKELAAHHPAALLVDKTNISKAYLKSVEFDLAVPPSVV